MAQQMITSVTAKAPSQVTVSWRSGKHTTVDITEYLDSPGYENLRDRKFFESAAVEEWGHGIEWGDGELGIDADTLYRLGKEQAGLAYPVTDFNAWMERNGLSLGAAAKALGITRRTIVYYHGGHKPIPIYIRLACIGWETLRLQSAA
ncbi:DUF2442 domain-containing protein [Geomonas paludis]|uniref:DUF2442 domain-containing protein n=1 Tax=Geomonas paludis TaxID=2740185 RepID=A0ABY4L9W1_9BACT|nr:DUF2442 domain-containing protein [Geomonas paludis]UPU34771.1 DUF2442 domain-containing protein [Geomonas paludis]